MPARTKEEIVFDILGLPYPKAFMEIEREHKGWQDPFSAWTFRKHPFTPSMAEEFSLTDSGNFKDFTEYSEKLFQYSIAHVGGILPCDRDDVIIKVMDTYNALLDEAANTHGISYELKAALLRKKTLTYAQFLDSFSEKPTLPPEQYIYDEDPRKDIAANYSADCKGYFEFLKSGSVRISDFFLYKLQVGLPESERRKHTYVCAKTGSGKSELLKVLIYSYLKKPDDCAIVLIEPHGDLSEEVARFIENAPTDRLIDRSSGISVPLESTYSEIEEYPTRLIYIAPGIFEHLAPSLNPFENDDMTEMSVSLRTETLKDAFCEMIGSATSGLTLQMEALIKPCIATLLRMGNATIKDLQIFMDDNRNAHLVNLGKQSPNEEHRDFFQHSFFLKTYESTKQSIYTKIQSLLNTPAFAHFIARPSTFDLEEAIEERKLVIFNLAHMGDDATEAAGRLITAMIRAIGKRRNKTPESFRVPCHVFIDECQNFISSGLEVILTELRKYKIFLTLSNQFLGQNMETQFKHALLSSTSIKIMGMNNAATLAEFKKETGVEVEDLQELKTGEFFVKCGQMAPFKVYVPPFLLKNRHSMVPSNWVLLLKIQKERYYRPRIIDAKEQQQEDIKNDYRSNGYSTGESPSPRFDL